MNQSAAPTASKGGWEHFPHDADVGLRGFGATVPEAFEQAAQALTAVVTDARVEPKVPVKVSCEALDLELLFVGWLNAIIYEMAVRQMLFGRLPCGSRTRGSKERFGANRLMSGGTPRPASQRARPIRR